MINQETKLVLHDAYFYDVEACYPTIMANVNYDLDGFKLGDKAARNVQIGKAQSGNENLSSYLMNSADKLLEFYLQDNDVKPDEILVTQRDGFILTRLISNDDQFIQIKLRGLINYLIFTPDRKKFLYLCDDVIEVRGMPKRYPQLDLIYNMFKNLNLYNKKYLFRQMGMIKNAVVECKDLSLFMIPSGNEHIVITKDAGPIKILDASFCRIEDVNTYEYYDHFFKPFLESLYLEYY